MRKYHILLILCTSNPAHVKDRTVIITGGSSGIGKACALRFAREGAKVVIASRNATNLQKATNELLAITPHVLMVVADVSVFTDCEKIIMSTLDRFGSIDILINNAGISMRGLFSETKMEVFHQVLGTNFWGTVYCTKLALPHLLKSRGSVVGISSIAGKKGLPGRSAYSASKFAIEGFLETVRTENLNNGLHVLIACPGFTTSGIRNAALDANGAPQVTSPLDEQKMMPASVVAECILNAVQHRQRDLVLTLTGKLTVLLNKFFPSFADRLLYRHFEKEPGSPFKH